jgi:hypothetical protein
LISVVDSAAREHGVVGRIAWRLFININHHHTTLVKQHHHRSEDLYSA